jgi:GNAT superfamily N-acetyltransferase
MSITITFPTGYKPVLKHGDHDQTDHGAWATQGSEKEKEIHERITDVKIGDYERDKYDEDDKNLYQKIEAKYKTKDDKTYLLSQENIKTPDGNNIIEVRAYEPKTLASGKEGRKQIGSLGTEGRDSSIIDGVYVDEEYQRQGIATAMLNMARTYAPDNMKISHSFSLTEDAKGWSSVVKHGDHDQSSHGSWATNNFDEETQGEEAQNTYFEKYGIKTDGSKDPVGISRDEIRSLNDYTADKYAEINGYLRRFGKNPYSESDSAIANEARQIQEYRIADLDKLIEEAPEFFGDKNLYRVFDKSITDTLEVGDVLTDKGFMSTTRVDITSQEGLDVLQNLQMIRVTDDTPSIILPSNSKRGKGLAVDYVKNAVSDLFDNVSTAANEKEVLLPRNTSLKFMGYKQVINETPTSASALKVAIFQRMDK